MVRSGAPAASTPMTADPTAGVGQGRRHPGEQAAPADRDHDHLGVGRLLGQLQADGALPGDDRRVVERRHVRGARSSAA